MHRRRLLSPASRLSREAGPHCSTVPNRQAEYERLECWSGTEPWLPSKLSSVACRLPSPLRRCFPRKPMRAGVVPPLAVRQGRGLCARSGLERQEEKSRRCRRPGRQLWVDGGSDFAVGLLQSAETVSRTFGSHLSDYHVRLHW